MLTTKLLADSTADSSRPAAATSPAGGDVHRSHVWGHKGAAMEPAGGQGVESPAGMDLGPIPEMLGDISMEGLEEPPEPSEGFEERYRASNPPAQATPVPSIFPGAEKGTFGRSSLVWRVGAGRGGCMGWGGGEEVW